MRSLSDVEDLRLCLARATSTPSTPTLDIEWLSLRCDDTLHRYTGGLQEASLRQLSNDVMEFNDRFPGLIHEAILARFR